jgi:salicylate hydroxylase
MTAALACARAGFDVEVFEQAPSIEAVGAGIQLSPNCSRVLHALGLREALTRVAFLPERSEMRHWKSGRKLVTNPLGAALATRCGAPYYHVHRVDLMAVLANAAAAEPRIRIHTNARVDRITQTSDRVVAIAGECEYTGIALVGADGIRSRVREALFGADQPAFTGNVAWRALVPAHRLPPGLIAPVAGVWWGPHRHFVHYYVRAGELVNCVAVVEKRGWQIESWTERGEHAELAEDFRGWHDTIRVLIDAMDRDACWKWALFDRLPMPRWSDGRITLLGDACHPTLPFMAQGAAMAIEDAAVLAGCLARDRDPASAFARYEHLRRARTARVQAGSRRNARVFHMTGVGAWLRNRAARRAAESMTNWLFDYDASADVNATRR